MPYPEEWIVTRAKPLCEILEKIRSAVGEPIHILSGYRTPEHNKLVGGKPKSQHVEGRAVDIAVKTLTPKQLYAKIVQLIDKKVIPDGGLACGPSFVHYDNRGRKARWTY